MNYTKIIEKFRKCRILVIGDVMLDKYIYGTVSRISPEAPVPIIHASRESFAPGGAANVAKNISSFGGTVYLLGIVGADSSSTVLDAILKKEKIRTVFVRDKSRPTIVKLRMLGHNQQLLRVDYENSELIHKDIEKEAIRKITLLIKKVDAVVVSDYAKGILTENLMRSIISISGKNNKPVVVDPKPVHKEIFRHTTVITPNNKEASEMSGIPEKDDKSVFEIGKKLVEELDSNIIITRGEKGMMLFEKNSSVITNIPTQAREVYDVTGAGDTVVAILTLSLCSGANLKEAASLANYAAGIVVGKIGTATTTAEELRSRLKEQNKS
ncbi:MAG TPA: D-glycero-beta-D-manno-heptose-7-phosphate kinase [Candidatus Nanoarchaeia archaeon]|nr:D-glycero-beta-D-manno-heptose-7-phosphate kinase [Candidatus Nanoarchaeia archaeon]